MFRRSSSFMNSMDSCIKKILSFTVNKQMNDKERIAAAVENPDLMKIIKQCIESQMFL